MARLSGTQRAAHVGLARRKADKVKSRGMGVTIEGVQLWALIDTIDDLKEQLESVDSSVMAERHRVELARVCADHKDELATAAEASKSDHESLMRAHDVVLGDLTTELAAARAERDEARRALATVPSVPTVPVEAPPSENGRKARAPRTKEEPWKSICVAADDILRNEAELWMQPLPAALLMWAEGNGRDAEVVSWVKALEPVLPEWVSDDSEAVTS